MKILAFSIALMCLSCVSWAQESPVSCGELISNVEGKLFILRSSFKRFAALFGFTPLECSSTFGPEVLYQCAAGSAPSVLVQDRESPIDLNQPLVDLRESSTIIICVPDVPPCAESGFVGSKSSFSPRIRNNPNVVCERQCSFRIGSQGGSIGQPRITTAYDCCQGDVIGRRGRYRCSSESQPTTAEPAPATRPPRPETRPPRPATDAPTRPPQPKTRPPRPATDVPTKPPQPETRPPRTQAPPSGLPLCSDVTPLLREGDFTVSSRDLICKKDCSFGVGTNGSSFGVKTRTYYECCPGYVLARSGLSYTCS